MNQAPRTRKMPTETDTKKPSSDISAYSQFAEFQEGYIRHYIALADTKAMIVFGISTSLLAYTIASDRMAPISLCPVNFGQLALVGAPIILLILSCVFCILVILPRTPTSGEGIVFFGAVAGYKNGEEFRNKIRSCGEAELTDARIRHCYDIARVCTRKYGHLRKGMLIGAAGIVANLIFLGQDIVR